ncbi:MAG: hypothetical protein HZA90_14140 [Verrucomicrobia bacterium]|nr:hypothetical protein [Verrucomicrobiota bacterium]
MKKETAKAPEKQLLDLLKKVLPKATHDPQLAGKIYQAIEDELKAKSRAASFEKFCQRVELPNLEPATIENVKQQLAQSFSDADVAIKPNRKAQSLAVEVSMADGSQFRSDIKVGAAKSEEGEDSAPPPKYVPFPVSLPGDKELVWLLGKQETLTPEEAGIALNRLEEDFWASKTGQKLLKDRVERCFPEFIARVPGGMLSEVGLKRHYKMPEPLKVLRIGPKR